jgi:tetratricopeptide (TPR) repeat protein
MESQTTLGVSCLSLATIMSETGEPRKACDYYDRAIASLGEVLRREPRRALARDSLFLAHRYRADQRARIGRFADALADWERALELDGGDRRDELRLERALSLAMSGDHARASAEAAALATASTIPADVRLYNVACVESLASVAAGCDAKLSPTERATLAERLAGSAVKRLGQARAAGFFRDTSNIASLASDTDLAPLRLRPDFRLLIMDLAFPTDPFAP